MAAKCAAIASRYTPRWSYLVSEAWKSSVEELESQELASLQKNSLGNHPLHSSTGRNLDWHPHPGYPGFPHSCHTSTRHGHIPQWKGGLSSWLSSSATLQETGQGLCSSCLSAVVFHHKFVAGWKMSHEILESQSFEIQSASIGIQKCFVATFLWTKKSQLLHLNLDSQVEPLERCFQWGSTHVHLPTWKNHKNSSFRALCTKTAWPNAYGAIHPKGFWFMICNKPASTNPKIPREQGFLMTYQKLR